MVSGSCSRARFLRTANQRLPGTSRSPQAALLTENIDINIDIEHPEFDL
jgi:hypothetical protein